MSAGTILTTGGRRLSAAIPLLFGLALLGGCNPDPYPEDLEYPLRTDLLVLKVEGSNIDHTDALGSLDQTIADLKKNDKADVLDPANLPDDKREQLAGQLKRVFGTPSSPTMPATKDVQPALRKLFQAEKAGSEEKLNDAVDETLASGSILYRRHCVHCHGLTGDGHGPTAAWVNPHPRDYRRGLFKFTSVETSGNSKPRRLDLLRTLHEGIEGTSMPSFRNLPEGELNDLVSYVIHLSVRGQVEFEVTKKILEAVKGAKSDKALQAAMKDIKVPGEVKETTAKILGDWLASEGKPIQVPLSPYAPDVPEKDRPKWDESVREGWKLFLGEGACINCHTDYGRQAGFRYDSWGTLVRPANLTQGVYRGGRRPLDLYYRISNGIPPSDMSAAIFAGDAKKMWDLVNFIRALPYPAMLPDDVKEQIYGTKKD